MQFKVGDKVKVTKKFLLILPRLADKVKNGGVVIKVFEDEAMVKFYSGYAPYMYLDSLELKSVRNQQLLFEFME